jgi:hypothetical protein
VGHAPKSHAPKSHGIGPDEAGPAGANTDSCFVSFFEPQCGQAALPSHWLDDTNCSKSFSHLLQ